MRKRKVIYILFVIMFTVINACSKELSKGEPSTSYRIISYEKRQIISYESFINELGTYDLIFLGELHNNRDIHYLEFKIVQDFHKQNSSLAIAMEMFERDTQNDIDAYLRGDIDETSFLSKSRPWSNYKSDYRKLVEYAKIHSVPIIGMNTPRPILKEVLRGGETYVESLYEKNIPWLPPNINWNNHIYKDYFYNSLPKSGHTKHFSFANFFIASLLKDSTMAKAINEIVLSDLKVVSINGSFHSDYGVAIPNLVRNLNPNVKIAIVSFLPGKNDRINFYLLEPMKLADYLISIE